MVKALIQEAARRTLGSVTSVATSEPAVALTFDDGPDPRFTPALLDVLASHKARATFFVLGQQVIQAQEVFQRLVNEGHAVGNHTWDHPSFRDIDGPGRRSQIKRCGLAMGSHDSRLFRPPFGKMNLAGRLDVLRCGYRMTTWSAWGEDWKVFDPADVVARVEEGLQPGAIVLLHDRIADRPHVGCEHVVEAVDRLLARYGSGFDFVTVPDLFNLGKPVRKNWYW